MNFPIYVMNVLQIITGTLNSVKKISWRLFPVMIRKMTEVDVKEALRVVYKQIEVACEKRKPVSCI